MSRHRALPTLLLLGLLLPPGCAPPSGKAPDEAPAVRLVDEARDAEVRWPRRRQRRLPEQIDGPRGFNQLRRRRLGRLAMVGPDGGDKRLALIAPVGTRYRFDLELPEAPRLRVGLGFLAPDGREPQLRFEVAVLGAGEGNGERVVVHEEVVTAAPGRGWIDLDLDLSPWSAARATLELRVATPDAGPPVWAAWSAPEVVSVARPEGGWDVLLVSLDTLRADRLGCYGYERPTSPRLDAFAEGAVRFATAVSQAPWTQPSHLAMLSGFYPSSRERPERPTLVETLHRAGYRTEAYTGGGQMDYRLGWTGGFDGYGVFDWIRDLDGLEARLDRSAGRRRFVFLHTYEVHEPYIHTGMATPGSGGRVGGHFDKRDWDRLRGKLTAAERAHVSDLYDGGIAYTDARLGELFDRLERRGLLDRTIVVVTSDHGEQFWEHGTWRHGMNLYDHQLLVPLIVRLPPALARELGVRAGRVVEQQVRLIDLQPTILELLGIAAPHRTDGRSLRPLLAGDELPEVDAFAERLNVRHRTSWALRGRDFKFIHSLPRGRAGERKGVEERWDLYDLRRDPAELDDLASRRPEAVEELQRRLETLLELLADPDELPDPDVEGLDPDLEERLRALGYLGE